MDTFNLNSELYNDEEIETLFNLKKPYTQSDILKAKDVLLKQLISNKSLGAEKQREISFFIDTISTRITNKTNYIIQQGSNFLIENVNTIAGRTTQLLDGRLAGQGDVPPGFLNPINVRTLTQTINIDTRFRPNYYGSSATNFNISLPSTQKNVVKMRIASIEIPMSYHAISKSSGNNTCLIIDASNSTNCWLVILPDGNYEQSWAGESNASYIETAMNNAIATATPGTIDLTTGKVTLNGLQPKIRPLIDLCFALDRISGRSVFAVPQAGSSTTIFTKGFTVRFNIDVDGNLNLETNIQMRLGWQLGFRSAQYVCGGAPVSVGGTSYIIGACLSEGICLICGPRYGFISIEDYQKNTSPSYVVAYANSILQNNVITRVNLSSVLGDVGVYQISNDLGLDSQSGRTREYFGAVDIQKLQITMYDEYGRIINLNNMDWSFTLEFDKLYD